MQAQETTTVSGAAASQEDCDLGKHIKHAEILATSRRWPGWVACFLSSFALYAATAARGAQWQDSGYYVLRAVTGELVNPLGLALTHPLQFWLARVALWVPAGEPAYRITLVSALVGALAVANVYGCVRSLGGRPSAALFAAGSLALANTYWKLSTLAETYAVTAAALSAECWCLIAFLKSNRIPQGPSKTAIWQEASLLAAMYFFNGLSLANHNFALLTIPVLVMTTLRALRRREIGVSALAASACVWLIGASPYLFLMARQLLETGDWKGTLWSALFGVAFAEQVVNVRVSLSGMLISFGFVLLSFPNMFLPISIFGIRKRNWKDSWLWLMLLTGLCLHVLFAFRYPVPDQHYFFLPTYLFLALFAGVGFSKAVETAQAVPGSEHKTGKQRRWRGFVIASWALLVLTPFWYVFAPDAARRFDVLGYVERNKPYRDDYRYLLIPWSAWERSADRLSRHAVELAGENGVIIVEDKMAVFAVQYEVLRSNRDSIRVVRDLPASEMEAATQAGTKIVLIPSSINKPMTHPLTGSWQRVGDLYMLEATEDNKE